MPKYKRILLKLSGESLQVRAEETIDAERLLMYAQSIKKIYEKGVEIGVVFGGGNIFRGLTGSQKGFDRVKGDQMGMLATTINALALQSALESISVKAELFTAFNMMPVGRQFSKHAVLEAFEHKKVAIFAAGTGNPYFTTDSAAALRSIEIEADILLKGTRVDGIYTADPEKDKTATRYESLTYDEVISKKLKVMDITAFALCQENQMPIMVFDMNKEGNLEKLIDGENVGTIVK